MCKDDLFQNLSSFENLHRLLTPLVAALPTSVISGRVFTPTSSARMKPRTWLPSRTTTPPSSSLDNDVKSRMKVSSAQDLIETLFMGTRLPEEKIFMQC